MNLFTCDFCGTQHTGPDPCPVCPTLTPKDVVCDELGFRKGVSVRRGRGTAHAWIYILTPGKVDRVLRTKIEERLVATGVCGTYLSDEPGSCSRDANVLWSEE